jgi:hypothetical protein
MGGSLSVWCMFSACILEVRRRSRSCVLLPVKNETNESCSIFEALTSHTMRSSRLSNFVNQYRWSMLKFTFDHVCGPIAPFKLEATLKILMLH